MIANFISPNWCVLYLIQLDIIKLPLSPSDVNKLKNLQLTLFVALATPNCCYLYISKLFLNITDFYYFLAICPEWVKFGEKKENNPGTSLSVFLSSAPFTE